MVDMPGRNLPRKIRACGAKVVGAAQGLSEISERRIVGLSGVVPRLAPKHRGVAPAALAPLHRVVAPAMLAPLHLTPLRARLPRIYICLRGFRSGPIYSTAAGETEAIPTSRELPI